MSGETWANERCSNRTLTRRRPSHAKRVSDLPRGIRRCTMSTLRRRNHAGMATEAHGDDSRVPLLVGASAIDSVSRSHTLRAVPRPSCVVRRLAREAFCHIDSSFVYLPPRNRSRQKILPEGSTGSGGWPDRGFRPSPVVPVDHRLDIFRRRIFHSLGFHSFQSNVH